MLTEGWDANSVTHILGVRAFDSQLLCEQVVARGLRRMNYQRCLLANWLQALKNDHRMVLIAAADLIPSVVSNDVPSGLWAKRTHSQNNALGIAF